MKPLPACIFFLAFTCGPFLHAAQPIPESIDLAYYLDSQAEYDRRVPTPKEVLGFEIGSRHLTHAEILHYLEVLAESSDRISGETYGETHGGRSLVNAIITHPDNHGRLEQLRQQHLQLADPTRSASLETRDMPLVLWMGYSIHGNEPSGANAVPLVAYHLAASRGREHEQFLRRNIVIIDPCFNPDGFDRFAHWTNSLRGRIANPDPQHREHAEEFPTGRTNYYWFDLNRDWFALTHPASAARNAQLHRWNPHLLTDFHEMSTNATYFFQPGEPGRYHPLTPDSVKTLTRKFAEFHASALDRAGVLYYTEEQFDDFYVGKGSTYNDFQGSIGILFEQASARGQRQESIHGVVEFPFTIRNQVLCSLSTFAASQALRQDLHEHKRTYYQRALEEARNSSTVAYIFDNAGDRARVRRLVEILRAHSILVHRLGRDLTVGDHAFSAETAYIVPVVQPQFFLLQALFETRSEFEENIFYDVSSWTLPLAFGVESRAVAPPLDLATYIGREADGSADDPGIAGGTGAGAYIVDWSSYYAPRTLHALLDADVRVKAAGRPFRIVRRDRGGTTPFGNGSLMIHVGQQPEKRSVIESILGAAARDDSVTVAGTDVGLTPQGIDLGSTYFSSLEKPVVALIVGPGYSQYEAGEVWHLLDTRIEMPVTHLAEHRISETVLADYNAVVVVSRSGKMSEPVAHDLTEWVRRGGTLIAIADAVKGLDAAGVIDLEFREPDENPDDPAETKDPPVERQPWSEAADRRALEQINGAILSADIDVTHPIGFGYHNATLPVFRTESFMLEPSPNPYATPLAISSDPVLSGYVSERNQDRLKGSASVRVDEVGRGRVISFVDNPNFRGFFYGTNKLFLNALFFGSIIDVPPTP